MIDLAIYIPACFAINLAFGPNNLLAMTHGTQAGTGFALRAGMGRILAFAPMIAISAIGLGVILSASAMVFTAVKIFGAAYLVWLGVALLRSSASADISELAPRPLEFRSAFRSEMLVAFGNPKAILVFAAFFPQFVVVENYTQSYLILGSLFLLMEIAALLIYAGIGRFAARAASRRLHWFQRASGFGMIAFGLLLLFTPKPGNQGLAV
ncbi:LysE family translocator [Cognatishimia activa]|uniref:Homoserine/homoserine lactone efflux protein n=1 Tax=Cognatishimia activa TaxID=1715691 RepID=A0A0P1IZ30_9RHOB|nr:LysE family translocator [Cognatishimia activa]CUI64535.1 Homoserine/homoserine lactone efflux protein [Cognatishimia activa]CUK26393.1 Homoserine/homoserine lactone efflux protein [Cognatishimia activa]